MKIVSKIPELQEELGTLRKQKKLIGLVPTMGALHSGHMSLIKSALNNGDKVVASIFVNPTQFNDPRDLERYPRDLDSDIGLLNNYAVDILFTPQVEEMYPKSDTRVFDLAPLDSIMEGKFRPGHFNGVAQIVSKLFEIVSPDRAYFGQKDFQQLSIIKKLVSTLKLNIEVVACPIVREKDGLAMSSRNKLLSGPEREAAPIINRILKKASTTYNKYSVAEIINMVKSDIDDHPLMKVEYFEIVDSQSLMPIYSWNDSPNKIGCIAVQIGEIRLIDNRYFD